MLFNGGQRGGTVTLFAYGIGFGSRPKPVVVPVKIEQVDEKGVGLIASADIPRLPGGTSLRSFELKIARFFKSDGQMHGYLEARCGVPLGFKRVNLRVAQIAYSWEGGGTSSSSVIRSCAVRQPSTRKPIRGSALRFEAFSEAQKRQVGQ
jgi:hypothetical protein